MINSLHNYALTWVGIKLDLQGLIPSAYLFLHLQISIRQFEHLIPSVFITQSGGLHLFSLHNIIQNLKRIDDVMTRFLRSFGEFKVFFTKIALHTNTLMLPL